MPRQREVHIGAAQWVALRAVLADGATNQVAADRLDLSIDTVKQHVRDVFALTGVAGRTELAVKVWSGQLDLINPKRESMILALEEYLEHQDQAA